MSSLRALTTYYLAESTCCPFLNIPCHTKEWSLSQTCCNPLVTRVFVVVDRFSKSCCLIPLKGLPTMMESAELLFQHVFRYFGVPEDIVSDRRPQFISKVWKSFFDLLIVTMSLSFTVERAEFLDPVPELGRVCTEFQPFSCHWFVTNPVRTQLPNPIVPVVWGTIRRTISQPLVPGE